MVLFDSPPLVAVTDATMISKEIDKIIIVVKVGQTENKAFEHTINALKNVSAPIGGIILNAVTESHNYGYYLFIIKLLKYLQMKFLFICFIYQQLFNEITFIVV